MNNFSYLPRIKLFRLWIIFLTYLISLLTCLWYQPQEDTCYACLTNKDCNSIQASIFKKHIEDTHPSINNNVDPPEHTLIIEADITSSVATNAHKRVTEHLRQ